MYGVLSEAKRKFGGEIKIDKNGILYNPNYGLERREQRTEKEGLVDFN